MHTHRFTLAIRILFVFLSVYFSPLANAQGPHSSVGELELMGVDQAKVSALLLNTDITGEVNGMIASITVKQAFRNQSDEWVNGRYVFPLPEGAAVDGLEIIVGERIIRGIVKEKAEAKKVFEQAKSAGKKAGLLEQHRPNLFSMSVANIGPQERVTAKITFIDTVKYSDDEFSMSLPTTLTPRYIPGAPIKLSPQQSEIIEAELSQDTDLEVSSAGGWANNTDQVNDANDITPPQHYQIQGQDGQTSHRFSLSLKIDAGLTLKQIGSASHLISTNIIAGNTHNVVLANQTEPMNRDLELVWMPQIANAPKAALFQQQHASGYYSMLMLTPPKSNASVSLPRNTTFVIDSSGSMAGESMQQAKQALIDGLTYLNAGDQFNVIDFDSDFHAVFERSRPATSRNISLASRMVNGLVADGGTEMMGALRFALQKNAGEAYLHQIVFITDGAIGNETELFTLIQQKLGHNRLFTVGIGSAPNSFFMNKAAQFGRGSYTYIRNTNQVKERIATLFEKITKPVMRDISLDWSDEIEQYPARIPDLYSGEPISVLVKSNYPIKRVTAKGQLLGKTWKKSLKVKSSKDIDASADNLDTVWARAKVGALMDQLATGELDKNKARAAIAELGLTHSIVTKFTSLVAVEDTPSKPDHLHAKHKNVPNLMPKGSAMPIPQTATPATLFTLLGGLMMLLSRLVKNRRRRAKA